MVFRIQRVIGSSHSQDSAEDQTLTSEDPFNLYNQILQSNGMCVPMIKIVYMQRLIVFFQLNRIMTLMGPI